MLIFPLIFDFVFGWLPSVLYTPVMGVFAAAFLIIIVKLVIALVEVLSKVLALFLPI